jgi:hypothetical protein
MASINVAMNSSKEPGMIAEKRLPFHYKGVLPGNRQSSLKCYRRQPVWGGARLQASEKVESERLVGLKSASPKPEI